METYMKFKDEKLTGNIIDNGWIENLKFKSGKTNVNACLVLSEIVYWYRPTLVRDETTGRVLGYKKKFKADKLQKQYEDIGERFGLTKDQVRDACVFLKKKKIITTEFRTVKNRQGKKCPNRMYIDINYNEYKKVTGINRIFEEIENEITPVISELEDAFLGGVSDLNPIPYQDRIRYPIGIESDTNTKTTTKTTNKKTDCPENKTKQRFDIVKTRNDKSEIKSKVSTSKKSVSTKSGDLLDSVTNNKKEPQYKIEYLKEIYSYDKIIGHYDSNIVDEVLSEILHSINLTGKKLKICGSKKEKNEKFELVEVFTSRVLKFTKNNIVKILKRVTEEMKANKITHVDLFVRTLCMSQATSYIRDKTKDKRQKELNTQNTNYKVPQEMNYDQREYTDEQVDGFCENYWDKYPK